ncbi:MAG: hypothetical protein ABJQ96_05975 [Crocinitomicaceae bacterium]
MSLLLGLIVAIAIFTFIKDKDEKTILLSVSFAIFIPWFMIFHRLFIAKLIIKENEIQYRSLFKRKTYKIKDLKAIDLIKKVGKMPPEFLHFNANQNLIIGSYFFVIRKTYIRPEGPFLTVKPVTKDYVTIQARRELKEILEPIFVNLNQGEII